MPKNKSWRELDSMRDKSSKKEGRFRIHTPKTSRSYKADLNKLFDKGEVPDRFKSMLADTAKSSSATGAARQQAIRKARTAETTADFNQACQDLIAEFDLPDDQKLLMRMLDHPEEEVIQRALEQLIEMDGRRPLHKRPLLRARLGTLEQIAQKDKTHNLLEQLGERL